MVTNITICRKMKFPIFYFLFLVNGLNGNDRHADSERNPSEYIGNTRLYEYLFDGYDKRVNAYKNGNLTVIHQAVDVLWMNTIDPSTSSYEGSFIFELNWFDDRLKWNPKMFDNKKALKIKGKTIWHPDISILAFTDNANLDLESKLYTVHSDGRVRVLFNHYLSGYCDINPKYFPFDEHYCVVII